MSRTTSTTITELRRLAGQATDLARAIRAVHARMRRADDEPTRRAGYRLGDVAGHLDQSAREITDTINDLTRIAGRGTCRADWGLCPEHGNTLASSGRRTWCQRSGCRSRWDYDRGSLPCTEPAAYTLANPDGGDILLCAGHGRVAMQCITGPVTLTSIR